MDPENLSFEALSLFNHLSPAGQRAAIYLAQTLDADEAVYIATLRTIPDQHRRKLLFSLSKKKWGL